VLDSEQLTYVEAEIVQAKFRTDPARSRGQHPAWERPTSI